MKPNTLIEFVKYLWGKTLTIDEANKLVNDEKFFKDYGYAKKSIFR